MKSKDIWITIGIILFVLLIGGILLYRSGKKRGGQEGAINISSPVIDNPSGNDSTTALISTAEIKILAQGARDDMAGINLTHNTDLWNRITSLSDTDFVKLNNEFNYDFQKDSSQSFKEWIYNETAYWSPTGTQFGQIKNTVLTRLARLNIQ